MATTYTQDDQKEALKLAEEIGVTAASRRLGSASKHFTAGGRKQRSIKAQSANPASR